MPGVKSRLAAWSHRLVRLSGIAAFALFAHTAGAGPANPLPFKITQPNGNSFTAYVRGDEFQNWIETAEGYTVVKNSLSGAYEYAVANAANEPILSGVVVVPDGAAVNVPPGQWPAKHLKPPRNVELEGFQEKSLSDAHAKRFGGGASFTSPLGTWAPTPVTGPKKILMVLVNFSNSTLQSSKSISATYWGNVVHSTSAQSVAKYYQDNSFSSVSVVPVTSTQPGSPNGVVVVDLATPHPNCQLSCSFSTESTWINSALAAAAPYVNFGALDTNADGTISVDEALVYFVLAGYEASAGSSTPSIWAHAWGGSGVAVAGKNINHWALNGERFDGSTLMTMGVVTHEMGHAMGGLPDLYDTSGNNGGLGIFSLMASGSWGAKAGETGGTTPVGMDGWSRQYLGWSTPQEPVNGSVVSFPTPLTSRSSSVMLMNSAVSTSEYWLVENRPPVGWDAGMATTFGSWSGGLLIQHIDLNIGSKSANSFNRYVSGSHQGNMAVEASNVSCTLVTPPGSWGGCASLMYYAGNNATFNAASTPNSRYYSGALSSVGVTGISAPSSTMTATIVQVPSLSSSSITLGSTANPSTVGQYVTYTAVVSGSSGTPTGTIVFRDGGAVINGCGGLVMTNGRASCTIGNQAQGTHSMTAVYSGNGSYSGVTSSTLPQVVSAAKANTPNITLGSSVNPSTFGQYVEFTGVVSGSAGTPTGTLAFLDNGDSISGCGGLSMVNGQATCTPGSLAQGSHSITVVYSGNGSYNGVTSSTLPQTVGAAKANTPSFTLGSSQNPSTSGNVVTFSAVLTGGAGTPTGTVVFRDNGIAISGCGGLALTIGRVSCSPRLSTVGTHSITGIYLGDSNYNGITSSVIPQIVQ
jgi:M6 family metalloprotease-like protein